jgi:hypothetical protein
MHSMAVLIQDQQVQEEVPPGNVYTSQRSVHLQDLRQSVG